MTESTNNFQPATREEMHRTFGGLIYESDFNSEYWHNITRNRSIIADRIASDWRFDQKCRKNAEIRERTKKYKAKHDKFESDAQLVGTENKETEK